MSALAIPMEPLVLMSQLPRPDDVPESRQGKLPVDPESSFALVLRARTGDEAAIEQLFSRYSIRLRRWAHGRLPGYARSYGDTNDLVQDTMFQVFKSLDRFEPRHAGAFLAFVRQTLRNKLIDRLRAAKSRGMCEPIDDLHASTEPSPHDEMVAARLLDRYEHGLERLKPAFQEAIFVRVELGLPWAEVMDILHKPSVAAAQMTVRRALVALAREMGHELRA